MQLDDCAERVRLSRPVVDAITEVYRARREYDSAKQKRSADVEAFSAALQKAREAERKAQREFDEHIRQHRCLV